MNIEKVMRGGKLLSFFGKNPKGRPFGSTKNRTTVDVSFPVDAVAVAVEADEANKKNTEK